MSTADEIKKLNELLRDRVISQEEFDAQKDKLLKKSSPSESDSQWVVTLLLDRKSTRLNSSHSQQSRMPSSA